MPCRINIVGLRNSKSATENGKSMSHDLAQLRTIFTSALASDCLDAMGYGKQVLGEDIHMLSGEGVMLGYAFPVQIEVVDSFPEVPYVGLLKALDAIQKDQVYVTPTARAGKASLWGELLSTACNFKGVAGSLGALAMGGHVFLDGLALGVAFKVSSDLGIAVFIALLVHAFSDGLNTVSFLIKSGKWGKKGIWLLGVDAIALFRSLPQTFRSKIISLSARNESNFSMRLAYQGRELAVKWGANEKSALKVQVFNALVKLPENKNLRRVDLSAAHAPIVK